MGEACSTYGGEESCVEGCLFLISMVAQLFMQGFGLLNQFLPFSSILDKGLPIWHF